MLTSFFNVCQIVEKKLQKDSIFGSEVVVEESVAGCCGHFTSA
jgi:hypothetical protein